MFCSWCVQWVDSEIAFSELINAITLVGEEGAVFIFAVFSYSTDGAFDHEAPPEDLSIQLLVLTNPRAIILMEV